MRAILYALKRQIQQKIPINPWLGYWLYLSFNKYLSLLVSQELTRILYGTLFALIIRDVFVGNRFYIPGTHLFKAISRSGFKVARKRHDIRDTWTALLLSALMPPP
jgi:hypothetical protein